MESNLSFLGVVLYYYQTLSVECLAFIVLETFQRYGTSVVNTGDESIAFNLELYQVFGIGAQVAVLVKNLYSNKTQVSTIGLDTAAVRSEAYLRGLTGGMYLLAGRLNSVLAGHDLYRTRLKGHVPYHMQVVGILAANAL